MWALSAAMALGWEWLKYQGELQQEREFMHDLVQEVLDEGFGPESELKSFDVKPANEKGSVSVRMVPKKLPIGVNNCSPIFSFDGEQLGQMVEAYQRSGAPAYSRNKIASDWSQWSAWVGSEWFTQSIKQAAADKAAAEAASLRGKGRRYRELYAERERAKEAHKWQEEWWDDENNDNIRGKVKSFEAKPADERGKVAIRMVTKRSPDSGKRLTINLVFDGEQLGKMVEVYGMECI